VAEYSRRRGLPLRFPAFHSAPHRTKALVVLLVFGLALPALASDGSASASVAEGWRYRWGDPPPLPDGVPAWAREPGDGAAWEPTAALRNPPGRGEHRFLWLSVPIPDGAWTVPGLLLGAVYNSVEVWAGGRRIYQMGTLEPGGTEAAKTVSWHLVPLPRSALGGRVLLRIQSTGSAIGVRSEARVGELDLLRLHALRANLGLFSVGLLQLLIALVFCGLFVIWGRKRELAALGAFALGSGMMMAQMSGYPQAFWGPSRATYLLGGTLGILLVVPSFCDFLQRAVLHRPVRWLRHGVRALFGFSLTAAALIVFVHGSLPRLFPLVLLVAVACLAGCLALAAREALGGNPDARIFVGGMAALLVSTVGSVMTALGVERFAALGFVLHWGILAMNVALVVILGRRAAEASRDLRVYAGTLGAQQQKVSQLAERMGTGADELARAVGTLRSSSALQNEGVGRQEVALRQAQATVAELRQSSEVTAENAQRLAASATDADEAGRAGFAALERTLRGLEDIRREVSEMAQRIHAQEARTQQISSIVETVNELADQSNVLAVNAALEAQRSGEHGRGFAVVAREVRNLATQSIAATARIRDILKTVEGGMREAAGASARGEERVRQSVTELQASGEQLQRLALQVAETGASVRQMTQAVAQQDTGIRHISGAIGDLLEQMQETLVALQSTEGATVSVERLAQSMSVTAGEVLRPAPPARTTPSSIGGTAPPSHATPLGSGATRARPSR
jgi:methyl-accepting chemotaxis protein